MLVRPGPPWSRKTGSRGFGERARMRFTGSAIAAFHMNDPPAFPVPLVTVKDVEIRLFQGIGLYLVGSSALLHHSNITYVQLPGASGVLNELIG